DCAPGDRLVWIEPAEHDPELPCSKQSATIGMNFLNPFIPHGIRAFPLRVRAGFRGVICTRSDLHLATGQDTTDPLDSEFVTIVIDEVIDIRQRRSSSAWAKYALAFRRISLARRSSRISFSNSVMRCLSSVVIPGVLPESTWFCFTQLRRVFLLIPICSPTSRHAVLTARAGSSVSFSLTMRTARSRTSTGYL